MSSLRRLVRNTSSLILANAVQPVLSFYFIVTVTRMLGVDGLGAYSTVFNYQMIFQIFASFGLKNLLTRSLAQKPEDAARYLLHGLVVALPFALMSMAGMVVLVTSLDYPEVIVWATIFLSLSLIPAGLIDICEGVVAGSERLHFIGYTTIAENLLRVLLSIVLLWLGFGLYTLVGIFVTLRFARLLAYLFFIFRNIARPAWPFDFACAKQLVRQGRVFALTMACVTIYWRADVSLLSLFGSIEDVGIYTAAYRFFSLAMIVVDSFVNSLFPMISGFYQSSGMAFERACKKSLQVLLILTVPIALVFSLFAEPIVLLVYKEKLASAVPVLQWLIWALVPYAVSQIFAYALLASNNQRYDLFVNAASMIANFALNWFLIRRYGFMGATWAALIAIAIYVILQLPFVLARVLPFELKSLARGALKMAGAAAAVVACAYFSRSLGFFSAAPLALLVYLTALFILRIVSRNDLAIIFRLFGKTA